MQARSPRSARWLRVRRRAFQDALRRRQENHRLAHQRLSILWIGGQAMKRPTKPASATVRCAIYTRKSTEEGLEQEFNSLDAQRESAEAFIKSQRREGWIALPGLYDDGGFTGANMDRPALTRLLHSVEAGELDCVVVYKVDRLSRSLLDFTRMLSLFEKHHVSFVAVTSSSTPARRWDD